MEASDVRHLLDFGSAATGRVAPGVAGYMSELLAELGTRRTLACVLFGVGALLVLLTLFADRRRVDP
jgi:hypothetical protein